MPTTTVYEKVGHVLKILGHAVGIRTEYIGYDAERKSDRYRVRLTYKRRRKSFDFYMPYDVVRHPRVEEVLLSLLWEYYWLTTVKEEDIQEYLQGLGLTVDAQESPVLKQIETLLQRNKTRLEELVGGADVVRLLSSYVDELKNIAKEEGDENNA